MKTIPLGFLLSVWAVEFNDDVMNSRVLLENLKCFSGFPRENLCPINQLAKLKFCCKGWFVKISINKSYVAI
jgi:hypothetical protein